MRQWTWEELQTQMAADSAAHNARLGVGQDPAAAREVAGEDVAASYEAGAAGRSGAAAGQAASDASRAAHAPAAEARRRQGILSGPSPSEQPGAGGDRWQLTDRARVVPYGAEKDNDSFREGVAPGTGDDFGKDGFTDEDYGIDPNAKKEDSKKGGWIKMLAGLFGGG
jgi:hypothetical protein